MIKELTPKEKQRLEEMKDIESSDYSDKEWKLNDKKLDFELSKQLQKDLKNQTVYSIIRYVSNDGMNRVIDLFYIKDGKPEIIHYRTNQVFSTKRNGKRKGYQVHGSGMDMAFSLVSGLGYHLFDDYTLINSEIIS
jgi:hypothetical protein